VKLGRYALALTLLVVPLSALHAQQQTIVHERQLHLHHIQGVVVDRTGNTVEYAVVELCDPKDHHVIASTFADGNGKFAFEDRKRHTILEIRASAPGFNPVQYTIKMTRFGDSKMHVVLLVAA
jgi:hypothetical protein